MALLWRFLLPRTNGSSLATAPVLVFLPLAIIVQRTFGFGLPATFAVLAPRATALRAAVSSVDIDTRTNSPTDNAFRLKQYRDAVELQTAAYKVTPRRRSVPDSPAPASEAGSGSTSSTSCRSRGRDGTAESVEILLVSMVHLADQAYYREIMRDASSYDRVLFELIAGPDVSELDQAGNRAVTEYMYPTREQEILARNYGLAAQLNCLNYCHLCKERAGAGSSDSSPRWILADLSRDKVQSLQKSEGEKEIGQPGWQGFVGEVTRALLVGRQAGDQILPKFFPPLGSSLNGAALALRALLWLAPCPEAEIMLLDWARTYPRAGGLSVLASAIVERALSGDFFTARKLGFAQQIVCGQAGGGNWGQSNEVIVKARNSVVVAETERALSEGCRKIMIMYGGLHMQDLAYQLCKQLDATREPAGWRTAWVVPMRTRSRKTTAPPPVTAEERKGRVGTLGDEPSDIGTRWGPLAVAALAYVAVGAWDWTDTVEALARDLTSGAPPAESIASAVLVSVLYVARHAYLYYGLARWLVQWEKTLF